MWLIYVHGTLESNQKAPGMIRDSISIRDSQMRGRLLLVEVRGLRVRVALSVLLYCPKRYLIYYRTRLVGRQKNNEAALLAI